MGITMRKMHKKLIEIIAHFQVQNVNSLATELAKVMGKERALLEQCTDFNSLLADMQVYIKLP